MKRLSIKRKHSKRLSKKGYWAGYKRGREQGSRLGQASFGKVFEGVSIIIPSYNQLHRLRTCIDRIEENTSCPHEIIVVDCGSTDGTRTYLLRKSIAVRYALLQKDIHLTGSLNQGLMMAKGTTIVVLDPNALVTPDWLDRLLECLHSDPRIGVVGPVTNGPFGEQQIEAPYTNENEARLFAISHNVSNPAAWRETKSLAGFCLLLSRETLEKTGYWDEGCHSGQEADADWLLRVRLLGTRLAIAGDAFIHCTESDRDTAYASPQTTGEGGLMEESSRNRSFFVRKWGGADKLLHSLKFGTAAELDSQISPTKARHVSAATFYPIGALVQGPSGAIYRLEPGGRRLLHGVRDAGGEDVAPVRVSQLDLMALPLVPKPEVTIPGDYDPVNEISPPASLVPEEAVPVLAAPELENMPVLPTLNIPAQRIRWIEVLYVEGGQLYQIGNGWKRSFLTPYAAMSWLAADYRIRLVSPGDLSDLAEEQPIIAPPVLHGHL
ncbi:glycosyltransferase family 2 protein [Paenibacillus sp. RC21]|uniref:glycosyltransferase family 2 protein n=1 Tax=Paenibacillus sp. RC21 TaxID=3156312 RepID=UPI003839639B